MIMSAMGRRPIRALEILEGKVIGNAFRDIEPKFLKFLGKLDDEFPEKLKLHL